MSQKREGKIIRSLRVPETLDSQLKELCLQRGKTRTECMIMLMEIGLKSANKNKWH